MWQKFDLAKFDSVPDGFISLDALLDEYRDSVTRDELCAARRDSAEAKPKGLAKLRLQAGMSQADLADLVGTSQPRLSSWESRNEKPSFENIQKLSAALDVDFNALFEALS
ncbi:MAG TPA: helix-turn-helix transcriptional regulator [Sphingopyxis sp.]|jgi:DNA-binding transcriptional regulator YiaG|uniref:helix-turn-helix transcriptional regulator n=1 Tax=Sphingopyxis sp. TaxID=1908224 RepID=UPI002E133B7F|nr:helix-turn-helix transcriptional regulator [Sphingopyxis sp.]